MELLDYFSALSAIPRPSGGEGGVTAYLARTLTELGLVPEVDKAYNLRCLLPAAPGFEHAPGVILQAHTDMVCVTAPGSDYRPGQDPIALVQDGPWLRSDGRSSLGADNGIAVAAMLALAEHRQFSHGPVLLLFTACEERGLVGAKALDPQWLAGFDYYINLDAFRGDAAIFASAGGLRQSWSHPITRTPTRRRQGLIVTLSGLTGGHSGFDIHRGRENAVALLIDLVGGFAGLELCSLSGGSDYNAIPTSAAATVALDDPDAFRSYARGWEALVRRHCPADPGLTVTLTSCTPPDACWDWNTTQAITTFFTHLPRGPRSMRTDCPDTVAVSANAAVLALEEDAVTVRHFARCATPEVMEEMERATGQTALRWSFTRTQRSSYAPWAGTADNRLTRLAQSIYHDLTGAEMEAVALHVGLESSLILEKNPALTGIALGCDIQDAHSVSERVRLDSIPRMEQMILELLNALSKEEGK